MKKIIILIFIFTFIIINVKNFYNYDKKSKSVLKARNNNSIFKENFFNYKNEIPKIIYKKGTEKKDNLSKEISDLFLKIKKQNPNFKLEYYSDKEAKNFIKKNFNKEVVWAFDKLKPGAYKADLFRYCILYIKGGIYSDLTDDFLIPLEEIINFKKDKLFLIRDSVKLKNYKEKGIAISFLATVPNNRIFKKCIEQIVENCKNNYYGDNTLCPTGPYLIYDVLKKYKFKYNIKAYFDGIYYIDLKTKKKLVKYKSLGKKKVNKILKNKHYSKLWAERDIYN